MRFQSVFLLALLVPAFGFHPSFRAVPGHATTRGTELFMADEIKDYKKGLSKINGQGSINEKVSFGIPI